MLRGLGDFRVRAPSREANGLAGRAEESRPSAPRITPNVIRHRRRRPVTAALPRASRAASIDLKLARGRYSPPPPRGAVVSSETDVRRRRRRRGRPALPSSDGIGAARQSRPARVRCARAASPPARGAPAALAAAAAAASPCAPGTNVAAAAAAPHNRRRRRRRRHYGAIRRPPSRRVRHRPPVRRNSRRRRRRSRYNYYNNIVFANRNADRLSARRCSLCCP